MTTTSRRRPTLSPLLLALGLLALAGGRSGSADDRQLLKTSVGNPQLMILLDTSGSMNWAPECSQTDFDDGKCDYVCPASNCPLPRDGDDPRSKIYLAKKALYDVLEHVDDVNFGFASLNQDTLAVAAKHWLYKVKAVSGGDDGTGSPQVPAGLTNIFAVGTEETFGPIQGPVAALTGPQFDFRCDRHGPTNDSSGVPNLEDFEAGCWPNTTDAVRIVGAANQLDAWKTAKLHRLPKGGPNGQTPVKIYVRTGTTVASIYELDFQGTNSAVDYASDDEFDVKVNIRTGCTTTTLAGVSTVTCTTDLPGFLKVTYERDGDTSFFFWETYLTKNNRATNLSKVAYLGGFPDAALPEWDDIDGIDGWASDIYTTESCRGWEPSGTTYIALGDPLEPDNDTYESPDTLSSYNLRFPDTGFTQDLSGGPFAAYDYLMRRGDVIPLDWDEDHKDLVLARLSPAGNPGIDDVTGAVANPEYLGQAYYFDDDYAAGEGFLRLKNEDKRPLVSHGLTPLAGWFSFFRMWYSGCGGPGNCDNIGWSDVAAYYDTDFACSKKYVLMITDGAEQCDKGNGQSDAEDYYVDNYLKMPEGWDNGNSQNRSQCAYRASLAAQEDIDTLVIGLGTENKNELQCSIGNQSVFYVDDYAGLKAQIEKFIGQIREEAAAFASAAVPTVQANIVDKIYLSSFIPLNDAAVWPGRLDTFLKPLPLDLTTGLPDRSGACDPYDPDTNQSACFAWDGGDSQPAWNGEAGYSPQGLLLQAPLESDFVNHENSELQIGTGDNERRVFFGVPDSTTLLGKRQYFRFPEDDDNDPQTNNAEQLNFEYAWNLDNSTPALIAANADTIEGIVEFTLKEKQGEIDDGNGNVSHVQYVMGDIFHSNPLVLNAPSNFDYYTQDLYWNQPLCGEATVEDTRAARGPKISYSYFSNKNLCRRVMLFVGSNDGQLHAFDGGVFEGDDCKLDLPLANTDVRAGNDDGDGLLGKYNFGSGREIFSFIPQQMMPVVKELSEIVELSTEYGIDGTPRALDVFVDPILTAGVADCEEREWRTVLLGSYREGGPGVYALDVTQPDTYDGSNVPQPVNGDQTGYVPSCTEDPGDATAPAGCDLPFPSLMWEFRDLDSFGAPADDDGNLQTDLAEGWSRPLDARIRVCVADCGTADEQIEDRFVAIFGGGISDEPFNNSTDVTGNWLYIVDIETGKLLYKRGGSGAGAAAPIAGSIAADVTGVDLDLDGYVDTIYFGTTAGYVYKVILGDGPFELDADDLIDDPVAHQFDPFQVFSTGGRPIYLEINAVYVPKLRSNALLIGTGNRWNLWEFNSVTGRFYTILDEGWVDTDHNGVVDDSACGGGCTVPLSEDDYTEIDPDSTAATANYLFGVVEAGKLPGWYFTLDADEKMITEPFTLAGVTFFTVFKPLVVNENVGQGDKVCALSGESKIFTVNTVTSQGYAVQAGTTDRTRYVLTSTFTTQPYVESSSTKNAPTTSANTADSWTDELALINSDLRKLLPPGSRFANYTLDIKTIRSDTGIVFIAPVPVAIEPHNWKEF